MMKKSLRTTHDTGSFQSDVGCIKIVHPVDTSKFHPLFDDLGSNVIPELGVPFTGTVGTFGECACVVIDIVHHANAVLLLIGKALGGFGTVPRLLQSRQQHSGKNGYYCNYNQQFYESKTRQTLLLHNFLLFVTFTPVFRYYTLTP